MAGRGRGRGRGQLSFSMEVVGIGKGDNLPPATLQPTPLFPPMEHKPVPLVVGEEAEYMLALKQEFRAAMKTLPFYIKPAAPKKDVERYSDKYQSGETENPTEWDPDWKQMPKELRTRTKRLQKEKNVPPSKKAAQPRVKKEEIIQKLETLEKKERGDSSDEEEEEKKKPEEEEQEEEEQYDEEEFEEETDYIMSYFDNGEEFAGDSDDNMDEAIY
ncbi:RNA polymerase III subunit GL b isoform X2 [Engraulis encrasicolus]|uniref:RNA polymerase III subunit GL b isoform X2 n=1 Tax=Engraulis encrasicolus TaxID=184585 RepID=UPI002FD64D17